MNHANLPIKKLSSNRFIEEINQENYNEDSDASFQDSFISNVKEGCIVEGVITRITPNDVVVDVGLKSDGRILIKELGCKDDVCVGAKIKVCVERIEGYNGNVVLSREKAIRDEKWSDLEECAASRSEIGGVIKYSIKCGFIVDLGYGITAFLPLSHVDVKQIKDAKHLIETEQRFIILKMDKSQSNIVVSRKLVLERSNADKKAKFLDTLNEGDIIESEIKSITHYGVFVGIYESDEVGVVDGLLHITDISWGRVTHPSTIFTCGQSIKVKIIKIDRETGKISLGIKQLDSNPWHDIESRYPVESMHKGHITSIEDYGCFVELEPGVEGLVYLSEISWIKNNLPVSSLVTRGQEIQVQILDIDTMKNRMSLSIKRCTVNPWKVFAGKYPPGSIVLCEVRNNLGSGVIVSFEDEEFDQHIEGYINRRDLTWHENSIEEIKKCTIGSKKEAKVIRINTDQGKIYLGVKQIDYDPLEVLIKKVKIGDKVQVTVSKIENSGLIVETEDRAVILIEQKHLPEDRKFFIAEKIKVKVLEAENYKIVLSAR